MHGCKHSIHGMRFMLSSGGYVPAAFQYSRMNVLLVEDDPELGSGVRIALMNEGMSVIWARRLAEAERELGSDLIDLVLLDLGLPDGDGLGLLRSLRQDNKALPVLVLTARDALADRVQGLDSGADDYLVKPFDLAELLSRIRALARRSIGLEGDAIVLRGLVLHEARMSVSIDGATVELSRSEFLLLCTLVKRADRVVTRRVLEEQVLLGGLNNDSNVLDVHISNLRKKIGDGYVRTVRGVGYVINRDAPVREVGA
jgi:two-component system, OmpR family, response regulator QseB